MYDPRVENDENNTRRMLRATIILRRKYNLVGQNRVIINEMVEE